MKSPPRNPKAFSLVEVAIAMGLVTFALIAMLGLLGNGLSASRESAEDTCLGAMASEVLAELRLGSGTATNVRYFDERGQSLPGPDKAVYRCDILTNAIPPAEISQLDENVVRVRLSFSRAGSSLPGKQMYSTYFKP